MSRNLVQNLFIKNGRNQYQEERNEVDRRKDPVFNSVFRYVREINNKDECYQEVKNREKFQPVFLFYLELIHKQSDYMDTIISSIRYDTIQIIFST